MTEAIKQDRKLLVPKDGAEPLYRHKVANHARDECANHQQGEDLLGQRPGLLKNASRSSEEIICLHQQDARSQNAATIVALGQNSKRLEVATSSIAMRMRNEESCDVSGRAFSSGSGLVPRAIPPAHAGEVSHFFRTSLENRSHDQADDNRHGDCGHCPGYPQVEPQNSCREDDGQEVDSRSREEESRGRTDSCTFLFDPCEHGQNSATADGQDCS